MPLPVGKCYTSIYISRALIASIDAAAQKQGTSRNKLVVEAIEKAIESAEAAGIDEAGQGKAGQAAG